MNGKNLRNKKIKAVLIEDNSHKNIHKGISQ